MSMSRVLLAISLLCIWALADNVAAQSATGVYKGTYLGADHGTVTITIDSYNAAICDFISDVSQKHFVVPGCIQLLGTVFRFQCRVRIPRTTFDQPPVPPFRNPQLPFLSRRFSFITPLHLSTSFQQHLLLYI